MIRTLQHAIAVGLFIGFVFASIALAVFMIWAR